MYGLIVIGDDLSSYIAAAMASRNGIKTALLSENGLGNCSQIGDVAFNTDTTPPTGFGENQICLSVLNELGISPEMHLMNPAYQVILPENRIDFFNDKEELLSEFTREFPDVAAGIHSFYHKAEKSSAIAENWMKEHLYIQPRSFKEYIDYLKLTPSLIKNAFNIKSMKRLASRNAAFRKVMEAQQVLLSFKTGHNDSIFSSLQYCAPLRGAYHFSRGKQTLFDALIKKIESSDGLYIRNIEILSVKKGKYQEITYKDKSDNASRIEADHLIVSTKWQNMRLLTERKKNFSFSDFIRPTIITHCPFTIHLGIRPQCLPEKMARHVAVVCDIERDIYDHNLIILESAVSENDKTGASKIPLSATVFLPENNDLWARDRLKELADAIIDRLEFFLPFLKENIEYFDIDESITISLKQRDVVNAKYKIRNSMMTGFAAKRNKTRYKNVYLTGASLLSDSGFEGEVMSGVNAVAQILPKRKV